MNNNGFPPFNQPWIVPAALILLIVVIVVLLALAIEENRHPHLRRHGRHQVTEARGEAEADTFISELRKSGPWENAARPASPAPSMVPEPPLDPLPGEARRPAVLPDWRGEDIPGPDTDDRPATVSEACWYGPCENCRDYPDCDCGHHREGTVTIRPAQSTAERYERLLGRPGYVHEQMHGHYDSDAAVNSILQRKLTPELLASLDADKAKTNGQVRHG